MGTTELPHNVADMYGSLDLHSLPNMAHMRFKHPGKPAHQPSIFQVEPLTVPLHELEWNGTHLLSFPHVNRLDADTLYGQAWG